MGAVIGTDVRKAAELLRSGAVVAIPTETVYGLAANAYDEAAVLRVFEAKQRPAFDPLIVHVRDRAQVDQVVAHVPAEAEMLIERFWPGPLTLVMPKRARVPDLVTSGLNTVGVRMPAHPLALELLRSVDFPLAAPSANPFGYVSPTTAQHVADQMGAVIPYILDGGPSEVGVESTILGLENERWVVYRVGGIPVERIEAVIGRIHLAESRAVLAAPGMLESHYAPRKPVIIGEVEALLRERSETRCAVISFQRPYDAWRCETLSAAGDTNEAARHLFRALRSIDASDADVILAEIFPSEGLGAAINDRLKRAATKR